MAVLRCKQCGHTREVGNEYIGKSVHCPQCRHATRVYETIPFINALLKKHFLVLKELYDLKKQTHQPESSSELQALDDIDIYNTTALTSSGQYQPIVQWFDKLNIKTRINHDAIDTTGFFDEIALSLGNNFNTLKFVSNQIKYVQNKGYENVKLQLDNKSTQEIKEIRTFCGEMYDYSFVAKYFYQKREKIIRLTLQTAPKIRHFFNGIWMEWFVLIKLLEYFRDHQVSAACMRSVEIQFANGLSNELDIFFLINNSIPVCIECKTGEFRTDIDKYLQLRKNLNIPKKNFIICVFGLDDKQTQGMSSMYDLTFTNERNFIQHIQSLT